MKKYFIYHGKHTNIYRAATTESADIATVVALLSEGWVRASRKEIRTLRKQENVVAGFSTAYIDASGALVIVNPD